MALTNEYGIPLPDDDGQALLLLCTALAMPPAEADLKPLKPAEWAELLERLGSHAIATPADLLGLEIDALGAELELDDATAERYGRLLGRAGTLALTLQAMGDKGLWVLPRNDGRYPARLIDRLGKQAPVALFGAGPCEMLQADGLTIVGSREADEPACEFARRLGEKTAGEGLTTISGGARGIDREAMNGGLEGGGVAIGVLPADLERTALTREHRALIADERLLLCSPELPDARWQTWRAMSRNKLLYALGHAAVIAHAAAGEGGTWQGAIEAIKARWVPVWARVGELAPEGNAKLVERGALPLGEDWFDGGEVVALFDAPEGPVGGQMSLFGDDT